MALEIEVTQKDKGVYVVSLLGSLDSATYLELEGVLKPLLVPSTSALILNLAALEYLSSMGVSVIFKTKKAIEAQGSSFMMTNLQPQIKRVFEIIRALPDVSVFESLQEADRYLSEMQRKALEEN
jgi:anti-sigma B factor antagonist